MSKKGNKKGSPHGTLSLIMDVVSSNSISERELECWIKVDHPIFSFRYLRDVSIDKCKDPNFFHDFLMRLQKLSELGWEEIRKSGRHAFGREKIPVDIIKPRRRLPSFVTSEVDLDVFRATGDNHVFVGIQQGKIFYIFFIEASFGDIYPHD